MNRLVEVGKRLLAYFRKKDAPETPEDYVEDEVSKPVQDKEMICRNVLEAKFIEVLETKDILEKRIKEYWEMVRPHVETAMEDPRAKQVALGSAVFVSIVIMWTFSGSKSVERDVELTTPEITPKPVQKPTVRVVRQVQWPLCTLIKQES